MREQSIEHPFGITVFGSATVRLEPDIASLTFAVSRLAEQPKDAFRAAREAAQQVRNFLAQTNIDEVAVSRITLSQTYKARHIDDTLLGYTARVSFHVVLRNLDVMEAILSGVVDAGTNEVSGVELQTSKLQELRADARRLAVEAARDKAANYCKAAGVSLGPVLHIEDIDPDSGGGGSHHMLRGIVSEESPSLRALDPGSISINGAVLVAYEIVR